MAKARVGKLLADDLQWGNTSAPRELLDACVLITSQSVNDDKEHLFGTGLVVGKSASSLICLTASHVLTDAIKEAFHDNYRYLKPFEPGFKKQAMENLWRSGRVRIAVGALNLQRFPLEAFSYEPSADIAMLHVAIPADFGTANIKVLPVNADIQMRGCEVVSVGCIKTPMTRPLRRTIEDNDKLGLRTLVGRITDFSEVTIPPIHGKQYHTTIPTIGGMSGGPVFSVPENEEDPYVVIGLISSGFEVDPPIMDYAQAGDTKIVPMVAAHLMEFDLPNGRTLAFQDLCEMGCVLDVGQTWKTVKVERFVNDQGDRRWRMRFQSFSRPPHP